MKREFNNTYYLLRHGKNIHQTEKKDIVYGYPDDVPPCELIEEGIEEAKRAGKYLADKKIDLIARSDTLRTKQTAEIVAEIIGYDQDSIIVEKDLRDNNWGIFNGGRKEDVWNYYSNMKINGFEVAPPGGESWNDCKKRVMDFFNKLEKEHIDKTILIVSHSNPLWLLEGGLKGVGNQELLDGYDKIIKTGEVRKI